MSIQDPLPPSTEAPGAPIDTMDAEKSVLATATLSPERSANDQQPEIEYPSAAKLALIFLGAMLATFVVCGLFLHLKIYANFDIKTTYLVALAIFEVGSVVCATATSSPMLIVGRAIAGAGGAAILSGSMNIIGYSVPIEKRAMFLATISTMFAVACVVGPLLGGAFTDRLSWRWCFWINLPLGGVAFFSIFLFFKSPQRPTSSTLTLREKISQNDILGAVFLISGVVCLLLALQWGGTEYPWGSSRIYGLFIGFGLLIAIFAFVQVKRGGQATIPPAIIKQRTVLISALYTLLFGMASFIAIYYLPFYFQAIKGTSAVGSGIRTIPYLASLTITGIIVGGLITATGSYAPFLWAGSALVTVGFGMLSTLDVGSSASKWIGYQILTGIGGGPSVQIPTLAVQAALSQADMSVGVSIVMFSYSLGGALAVSIGQNIFSNQLAANIPKYAPNVDPAEVIAAGAIHFREHVPTDSLSGVLTAYAKALNTTFIPPIAFAGTAFIVGLGIERLNMKKNKITATAA